MVLPAEDKDSVKQIHFTSKQKIVFCVSTCIMTCRSNIFPKPLHNKKNYTYLFKNDINCNNKICITYTMGIIINEHHIHPKALKLKKNLDVQ